MATYDLEPVLESTHGRFSLELRPALVVDPGDIVRFHTLDVTWGLENHAGVDVARPKLARPAGDSRYDGPALSGPVAVRGAEPGMTLRVDILDVRLGPWGWMFAGGAGLFNKRVNELMGVSESPRELISWRIDQAEDGSGTASNQFGHALRLRPFPGTRSRPPTSWQRIG